MSGERRGCTRVGHVPRRALCCRYGGGGGGGGGSSSSGSGGTGGLALLGQLAGSRLGGSRPGDRPVWPPSAVRDGGVGGTGREADQLTGGVWMTGRLTGLDDWTAHTRPDGGRGTESRVTAVHGVHPARNAVGRVSRVNHSCFALCRTYQIRNMFLHSPPAYQTGASVKVGNAVTSPPPTNDVLQSNPALRRI